MKLLNRHKTMFLLERAEVLLQLRHQERDRILVHASDVVAVLALLGTEGTRQLSSWTLKAKNKFGNQLMWGTVWARRRPHL